MKENLDRKKKDFQIKKEVSNIRCVMNKNGHAIHSCKVKNLRNVSLKYKMNLYAIGRWLRNTNIVFDSEKTHECEMSQYHHFIMMTCHQLTAMIKN